MLFWGWLWGPWGVAFAHPILMIFKAICDHVESLHPLSVLLSVPDERHQPASNGAVSRQEETDDTGPRAGAQPADVARESPELVDDGSETVTTTAG